MLIAATVRMCSAGCIDPITSDAKRYFVLRMTASTLVISKPSAISSFSRSSTLVTKPGSCPLNRNGNSSHFRKVVCRERQARNPACIDLKCGLLTQFNGPRVADEKILTRAPRAVIVHLGRGVEDDCKACIALTSGRGTQHNVW